MSIYDLPKTKQKKIEKEFFKKVKNIIFIIFLLAISVFIGLNIGQELIKEKPLTTSVVEITPESSKYDGETEQERKVMAAVEKVMPSVVSVIVKKTSSDIYSQYFNIDFFGNFGEIQSEPEEGGSLEQVAAGTGFIVSKDGLIITNKHVVQDKDSFYSILTNEGEEYEVEILSQNPVQDIAILKIKGAEGKTFPALSLGESSSLRLGQTAIAIGNALGMYQNSISVGVISGLERDVLAQNTDGTYENLEDIIQTDAAINSGNSGGPLLNLKGEVIAINTAVYLDGENIGFAVPIDKAKRDLAQVESSGKIAYPFIGVRYITLNEDYAEELELSVDYGAYIVEQEESENPSVVKNSPAEKAGLQEKDIILEVNGIKVEEDNNLAKIVQDYLPGEVVVLKILRGEEEMTIELTFADWSDF